MTFLLLLTTLALITFVSFSVFGGGQIFMPIFKWLWTFLNSHFHTGIDNQMISNLFTISNATPGVFSTKLAFATGYLVGHNQWWGFLFCFITYLVFVLVPILVMYGAMKLIAKKQNSPFLQSLMKIMNPVIVGIIGALILQLLIGIMLPQIIFNDSIKEYAKWNIDSKKSVFFSGHRIPILIIYVIFTVAISAILYYKKFPVLPLIIFNIGIALLVFSPWV
ncbi:chromate transporter [Mycoplasmopsis primatum]|uniref:chromate transporter n=1 Tax=Mycoplasmopsis primatum TaxID=55604 RepID=UPI0004952ED1|nr:chromate transporter [Mycoplasmopsis primatum]